MWLWLKAKASFNGIQVSEFDKLFGESTVTIRNHYNNLDRLTFGEFFRTASILDMEPEELFEEIMKWKRKGTKKHQV